MEKMGKCQEEIIDELYQPTQLLRYGAHERQTIRCRVPRGAKGSPVIVWFHGGGLVNGSYECPQMLFNGRFLIAEPLYRFSPEATPPEILEDAAAAVGLLWKQLDELGGDRNKLFLGGISAGAWLSAMLGMDPDRLALFGIDIRKLAGLLLVSGQMTTHFQLKADLGYPGDRFRPVIDRYAPLHFVAKELAPILLVTGEPGMDIEGRPEENMLCAASLKAVGHPAAEYQMLAGADHNFAGKRCGGAVLEFALRQLEEKLP